MHHYIQFGEVINKKNLQFSRSLFEIISLFIPRKSDNAPDIFSVDVYKNSLNATTNFSACHLQLSYLCWICENFMSTFGDNK